MSHPCCFSLGLQGDQAVLLNISWGESCLPLPLLFFSVSSSFSFFLILLLKNKVLGSTHRGFSKDLCHMRTLLWDAVGSMYSERLSLKEALDQQGGQAVTCGRAGMGGADIAGTRSRGTSLQEGSSQMTDQKAEVFPHPCA